MGNRHIRFRWCWKMEIPFHSRKRQRKYVMRIFRCMRAICMRMKIILCTTRFQIVTVYTIAKTKSLLRKKEFRNEMCIYSVVWGTALYLTARLTEKKENSCMTGGGMSESVSQIGQRIRRLKLEMKREIRWFILRIEGFGPMIWKRIKRNVWQNGTNTTAFLKCLFGRISCLCSQVAIRACIPVRSMRKANFIMKRSLQKQ